LYRDKNTGHISSFLHDDCPPQASLPKFILSLLDADLLYV